MRTAEEILEKNLSVIPDMSRALNGYPYIIKAINEARIEAIKECAELCDEREDNRFEHRGYIIDLIEQVK